WPFVRFGFRWRGQLGKGAAHEFCGSPWPMPLVNVDDVMVAHFSSSLVTATNILSHSALRCKLFASSYCAQGNEHRHCRQRGRGPKLGRCGGGDTPQHESYKIRDPNLNAESQIASTNRKRSWA